MSVLKNEKKGQGDGPKAVNIGTHRRPHPPPKSKSLFSSISLHAAGMINLKRTAGLWDDMYPHRSARSCHGANSSKSAFSVGFQSCFRWCEAWVGKDVYPRRVGMIRGRADRNSGSHGRDLQIHISTRVAFLGTRPHTKPTAHSSSLQVYFCEGYHL